MVYQYRICGYTHDEEKEGKSFSELIEYPICKHLNIQILHTQVRHLYEPGFLTKGMSDLHGDVDMV